MKRILILGALVLCLMGNLAYAETYVVCWRKVAMPGINRFGEQASCVKCTDVLQSDEMYWDVCPNGQGASFNSIDDGLEWKAKNCTCP